MNFAGRFLSWVSFAIFLSFSSLSQAKIRVSEKIYLSFEQRVLAAVAIEAHAMSPKEKSQLYSSFVKWFESRMAKGFQEIQVENFNEFLGGFRGEWPANNDLSQDLNQILNAPIESLKIWKGKTPRVQAQIQRYIQKQTEYLSKDPEMAGLFAKLAVDSRESDLYQAVQSIIRVSSGAGVQSEALEALLTQAFDEKAAPVVNSAFQDLHSIGNKIATSGFASTKDPVLKILMQELLSGYYVELNLKRQQMILFDLCSQDLNADDFEKFEILVQNSGPQLQKLLQIIARQGDLDPGMIAVFKKLEDAVKPVPWDVVQTMIQSEKEFYDFVYFERKPIGVGTMAQVHRAKINWNGKIVDVVVRFIKPNMPILVEEDRQILLKVAERLDRREDFRKAGAPLLSPVVEDVTRTVTAEFDLQATEKRQIKGRLAYNKIFNLNLDSDERFVQFSAPRIYRASSKSQFMIQEMVIGKKLDKAILDYTNLYPELKKRLVESLAKLWIGEVIFGSGFFHSDLHQGNFMVKVTDEVIHLTILDYGMGGTVQSRLRGKVLIYGAAIELNKAEPLAKAIFSIAKKQDSISYAELLKAVREKIAENENAGVRMGPLEWTSWATRVGVKLPYDFINLNRGVAILEKSLVEAGSPYRFVGLAKAVAMNEPLEVLEVLAEDSILSYEDWAELGYKEISKRFFNPSAAKILKSSELGTEKNQTAVVNSELLDKASQQNSSAGNQVLSCQKNFE